MDERNIGDERHAGEDLPPAPPTRGREQAVWVGLFLVLGLIAIFAALFILTDAAFFRGRYIVTTTVPSAGGIRRNDPVQMRGVNIGRVQRFKIDKESVDIRLELEGEYKVPADSTVELKSSGFLGGIVADIVPGNADRYLKNGDTIAGKGEVALMDVANRIASQAETVLRRVDTLLSEETIKNVSATTANTAVATQDLRKLVTQLQAAVTEQRTQLAALETSLQKSAGGLERITTAPEIDRSLKSIDTAGQRLDTVTASLERSSKSVEDVMTRVQKGEGSLGKALSDDELYRSLNQAALHMNEATVNINKLAEDVRLNPKRYFSVKVF
jgi:phospholipid/cholesterol/gamma-HCH transport system substrate-binding protein